jgi:hypothetical protein
MKQTKRLTALLLIAYFLKVIAIRQPSWIDGSIFLILAGCWAFSEAWSQLAEMKRLKIKYAALKARQDEVEKQVESLKSYVSSIKLGSQIMRSNNGPR